MSPVNSLASALLVCLPAIAFAAGEEDLPDLSVEQALTSAEKQAAVRLTRLSSTHLAWNDENRIVSARLYGTDANKRNIELASRIAGLRVLSVIALPQNYLTDNALAPLTSHPELQLLNLTGGQFSDNALAYIQTIPTLEVLILHGNFTDAALETVSSLPNLEHLDLTQTQVTDAGLAHLTQLAGLEVLILNETHISNSGLESISELKKLSHLYLGDTAVNDAAMEQLKKLVQLETLFIKRSNISAEGVAKLLPALPPNCRVIHDAGTDRGEREPRTAMAQTSVTPWRSLP